MLDDDKDYRELLEQKQFIQELSNDDEDINKLYFQEMVLESLTPEEKESYMRFLMEPRPRNMGDVLHNNKFEEYDHHRPNVFSRIKGIAENFTKKIS